MFEEYKKNILSNTRIDWQYDLEQAFKIYDKFPDSYSVLIPFFFSYMEELIRSLTPNYHMQIYEDDKEEVGMPLVEKAIEKNSDNNKLIQLLKEIKKYYEKSSIFNKTYNRNGIVHGYVHPDNWTKETFKQLIKDINDLQFFCSL